MKFRPITRARELLTDPTTPLPAYIIRATLVAVLPVLIATTVAFHVGLLQAGSFSPIYLWPVRDPDLAVLLGILDILLLSPLVETGVAFVPIWALRKVRLRESLVPVIAALFWGLIHARAGWFGMFQAWPFYCFSLILITFEKRSLDRAWFIASSVHSLYNVVMLIVSASLVTAP